LIYFLFLTVINLYSLIYNLNLNTNFMQQIFDETVLYASADFGFFVKNGYKNLIKRFKIINDKILIGTAGTFGIDIFNYSV
jgi:hypothetical protein